MEKIFENLKTKPKAFAQELLERRKPCRFDGTPENFRLLSRSDGLYRLLG